MSSIDRRAKRTRFLLSQALLDLGADHNIDDLAVGDFAQAAGVGRSTFYEHYANKEDFLSQSFIHMIGVMEQRSEAAEPRRTELLPARLLFEHVYESREFAMQMAQSAEQARMMAAGETKLRAVVEANLARQHPEWDVERRREAAVFIAAGFIGLLKWWIQSGVTHAPERMSLAFERLSKNALADT